MDQSKPIERQRLFTEISSRLERMILSGKYTPGDKLPPEQVLADKFGVSRNVVREAYKSLVERGLIVIKQGKGTFVTSPNPNVVSQAINRFIQHMGRKPYAHLYEIRRILEVAGARLAAERATDKDLRAMKEAIDEMREKADSREEWAKADLTFHIALAKATHNPFFPILLEPIAKYLLEAFILGYQADDAIESGLKYHGQIIERIQAKDAKSAGEIMLAHLVHSEEQVKQATQSGQE